MALGGVSVITVTRITTIKRQSLVNAVAVVRQDIIYFTSLYLTF